MPKFFQMLALHIF